jgi:hypothetical protein
VQTRHPMRSESPYELAHSISLLEPCGLSE